MVLRALLLDKNREVFPLLGDVFNVTGHKLLIATDENMLRDLASSMDIDTVILNHTDVKAWLLSWNRNATLPFFLTEGEEEEKRLISVGFSDLSYIRKPFNPLELLTKLTYLDKLDPDEDAHKLGLINTLVKLKRLRKSALIEVSGYKLFVKDGEVEGADGPVEELLRLLGDEETFVRVREYQSAEVGHRFASTLDFVKTLTGSVELAYARVPERVVGPAEEIEENLYRVSKVASVPILIKNVYLRVYEGRGKRVAFLINGGTIDEWSGVKNLVEDVISGINELSAVVLLSGELSTFYNVFTMISHNADVNLIADFSLKRALGESGCKSGRIRTFESFPSYSVTIATGHRLRFIPLGFSPYAGSFCLYEEDTGFLFTPEFLSSLLGENSGDIAQEVRLYHRVFMPSGDILGALISRIKDLNIRKVFPRYGQPYGDVSRILKTLSGIKTGLDFAPVSDIEVAINLLNRVLAWVVENEERSVINLFLERLGRFAAVEENLITDLYVEPPFTVELLLSSLFSIPGVKPSTLVGALQRLDKEGIFINPF